MTEAHLQLKEIFFFNSWHCKLTQDFQEYSMTVATIEDIRPHTNVFLKTVTPPIKLQLQTIYIFPTSFASSLA